MIECYFCGKKESPDVAIDVGWVPSFYADKEVAHETLEPVCLDCVHKYLESDSDGDLVRKAEWAMPIAVESAWQNFDREHGASTNSEDTRNAFYAGWRAAMTARAPNQ